VALRGEGNVTLKGGPGMEAVLHADRLSDTTNVTGLTIQAAGAARGISARASTISVRDVKIRGAREAGIRLEDGSQATIEDCDFAIPSGGAGVLSTASTVEVRGNHFVCEPPAIKSRPTEFLNFREHRVTNEGNKVEGCETLVPPAPKPAPPKKGAAKK
jgi:hypothetical protein